MIGHWLKIKQSFKIFKRSFKGFQISQTFKTFYRIYDNCKKKTLKNVVEAYIESNN